MGDFPVVSQWLTRAPWLSNICIDSHWSLKAAACNGVLSNTGREGSLESPHIKHLPYSCQIKCSRYCISRILSERKILHLSLKLGIKFKWDAILVILDIYIINYILSNRDILLVIHNFSEVKSLAKIRSSLKFLLIRYAINRPGLFLIFSHQTYLFICKLWMHTS